MPFSPILAFLLLLGVSGAAWAAEQPATDDQAELVVPPVVDLQNGLGAGPAPEGSGLAASPPILGKPDGNGSSRISREGKLSPLELRLGRTSAAGRNPGEAPPLYGEVGLDLGSVAGLSLVPSYRVVLPGDEAEESDASGTQILKLGARIRF